MKPYPTQERLKELFDYPPEVGDLVWRVDRGGRAKVGMVAGCVSNLMCSQRGANPKFYRLIRVDYKKFLAHRLIYIYMTGSCPEFLDHRDGNSLNNRFENLRPATSRENSFNSKIPKSNTSGIKGVYFNKRMKKWVCAIKGLDGKRIFKFYDTLEEAKIRMPILRREVHGEEFARDV